MKGPSISICVPAYKRLDYLQKLLHSIAIQTFKDYEVIITDDSPDNAVEIFVKNFTDISCMHYYRNQKVLGTPENWNEAVRKARGTWVKLMHDDDWFSAKTSLETFYKATLNHTDCSFFFSAYNNVTKDSAEAVRLHFLGHLMLKQSPLNLFKKQFVGNPSCTLIKRDIGLYYDNDFKWVVDFEYYIRCLKKVKQFYYIDQALVNVGLNEDQVTKSTFRKPEVEVPENHILLKKMGIDILNNVFVYDYYWRLYRNLGIRNQSDIKKYYQAPLHPFLKQIIDFQRRVPSNLLKIGIFSKLTMILNYMTKSFLIIRGLH